MYTEAEIDKLSVGQLRKLLKGGAVRVRKCMSGSGMKMGLSKDQAKKLESSHKKGKMTTLSLDPYQQSMMKGSGFDPFGINRQIEQAFSPVTQYATTTLPSALIHEGLPIVGSSLGGAAGTYAGGPYGGMAGSFAGGQAGKMLADQVGRQTGYGMKKKGRPRKGGRLVRDELTGLWHQIPEEYHAPIESMGRSTLKRMGFGMKKGGALLGDFGMQERQDEQDRKNQKKIDDAAISLGKLIDDGKSRVKDVRKKYGFGVKKGKGVKEDIKKYMADKDIRGMLDDAADRTGTKRIGGRLVRDELTGLWHQIPEEYHAPIESIGRSTLGRMGWGMKKGGALRVAGQ